MGFALSDLIIESILRDGFAAIRRDIVANGPSNTSAIDDIFGMLRQSFATTKYGDQEINRIKTLYSEREVAVVHSFSQVTSNVPCVSIQLIDDTEDKQRAHLDDFEQDLQTPITDPIALAALVIVQPFTPSSYNQSQGIIYLPDTVDLSQVHVNQIFQDVASNTFPIVGGIINTPGAKQILVQPFSQVNIAGSCLIKSSISTTQNEIRGNMEKQTILLGIHTKDVLTTKYLYTVVKYIIEANKKDLIDRGFLMASYSGSDFTRNLEYPGDMVYSRYLTLSGEVQNSWNSDFVPQIEVVEVQTLVSADKATGTKLGELNQTVRPNETPGSQGS